MGWRLRRSKNIGPFRVTLSKHGLGVRVGGHGLRLGVGPDEWRWTTVSAPDGC
jgi:hypothetical protein